MTGSLPVACVADYNIFTVGNSWEAARTRPLPEAIVSAMPGTVSAILTAGLALAASFGLLSVVPLVPFRQLAFVMAVGIMLDVLVVRALLLPAMLVLVGPVSAWPSKRLHHGDPQSEDASDVHEAEDPDGTARAPA
jgi:RND superfamily putative drug exporter